MQTSSKHVIKPQRVAKDIYSVVFDRIEMPEALFASNQGFIVLDESVLLFDTGFSDRYAGFLDDAIRSVTGKQVRYIIDSHDHSDHVFGNSYFFRKYSTSGLKILGHENCSNVMRKLGPERLRNYKSDKQFAPFLPEQVVVPDITYNSAFSLTIEGRSIVFVHPPNGAHTLGDTMIAIPDEGVMFLGDVFLNSFFPNIEDANIEEWANSLDLIDHSTYSKFLPGHGVLGGRADVQKFSKYLHDLSQRLMELKKPRRKEIQSCFETRGTSNWGFRFIIDRNTDFLMGKLESSFSKI